ncbi:MAG: hypothetical protein PHS97_04585 [Oscillospiraceae bacterium]|nr:hypothetical protein [Oscillospiraceae bacterium]
MNPLDNGAMPLGLGMALAQNTRAQNWFFGLSESEKQQVIAGTQAIASSDEMRQYVDKLAQHPELSL